MSAREREKEKKEGILLNKISKFQVENFSQKR